MSGEIEIYWVVLCKGGEPLYAKEGPFCSWDDASDAMGAMEAPGTTCHLQVMKSKLSVEE